MHPQGRNVLAGEDLYPDRNILLRMNDESLHVSQLV